MSRDHNLQASRVALLFTAPINESSGLSEGICRMGCPEWTNLSSVELKQNRSVCGNFLRGYGRAYRLPLSRRMGQCACSLKADISLFKCNVGEAGRSWSYLDQMFDQKLSVLSLPGLRLLAVDQRVQLPTSAGARFNQLVGFLGKTDRFPAE